MQTSETRTHKCTAVVTESEMLEMVATAVAKHVGISLLRTDVTWKAHLTQLRDISVEITIDYNKTGDADARQSQVDA